MENNEYGYEIQELFEMLKDDESWEADPAQRAIIAQMLPVYINSSY